MEDFIVICCLRSSKIKENNYPIKTNRRTKKRSFQKISIKSEYMEKEGAFYQNHTSDFIFFQ